MKTITYNISITCEVSRGGTVNPVGGDYHIVDKKGEKISTNFLPLATTIMNIWIGKMLQYPKIQKK